MIAAVYKRASPGKSGAIAAASKAPGKIKQSARRVHYVHHVYCVQRVHYAHKIEDQSPQKAERLQQHKNKMNNKQKAEK